MIKMIKLFFAKIKLQREIHRIKHAHEYYFTRRNDVTFEQFIQLVEHEKMEIQKATKKILG